MKSRLFRMTVLACIVAVSGCAGGWRNGVGPAPLESAAAAAASSAPAAAAAAPAKSGATHATADGAIFVYRGDGNSVNVAGEFNAWSTSADPLTKQADGSWSLTKKLAAGRYAYKFVIDGSNWKPDANASESVDDGYGAKNSVVVVGAGAGAASAPAAAAPAPAAAAAPAATGDGVAFKYSGPGNSVNLAGEFNAWSTSADPLVKQADGSWLIRKKLAAGRYAYKFVIDGTNWKTDPAATETVDDGYGGKNSLVVVGTGTGAAAPPPAAATAAPAAPAATGDAVAFKYSGPGSSVNLAGEFNAWSTSADPLVKQPDGSWALSKKLAAGRYAYKFVVDGTNWKTDPGAKESVDDGYGGKNSVVVVGSGAASPAPAAGAPAAAAAPVRAANGKPRAPQVTADGVTFTYAGPAKATVALCGDFNAWAPNADPLTQQADGSWTITKKLAAGAHSYKFLVDGSTWKADDGNSAGADDGFGGKNSVVTVK